MIINKKFNNKKTLIYECLFCWIMLNIFNNNLIFVFNIVPVGAETGIRQGAESIFVGWIAKQDGVPTT